LSLLQQATAYLGGVAPYHWLDFVNDRALYAGIDVGNVTGGTGYSFTRASDGYYQNSDGTLTNFASGALRRGDRGVLIEGSRTNLALWSRDFTNAAWVKVNATAALNQVGVDGTANSASSLTATAGLGTTLQTVISLSAARAATCYVKRITGTGTIEFTSDGVSYTNITSSLSTGSWFRALVTGTITNPVIGFRITTSGDAIAVDFAGLESATFPSSPIVTTTASATRAADILTYTPGLTYPLGLWAEFERAVDTGSDEHILAVDANTSGERALIYVTAADVAGSTMRAGAADQASLTVAGALALNTVYKMAGRYGTNDSILARGGTLSAADTLATAPSSPTRMAIGGGVSIPSFGYTRRVAVFNSTLTDAQLQTVTT
jgi:hypothetical protein